MTAWLSSAPPLHLNPGARAACELAWRRRDPGLLPEGVSSLDFLRTLESLGTPEGLDTPEGQGVLFHGSPQAGIRAFEARTPRDDSPDAFSKRTGVFASGDALWAAMYALRGARVTGMLNSAVQTRRGSGWGPVRYFLSLAGGEGAPGPHAGRSLLAPGTVYVLPAAGFGRMPAYDWPGLGEVLEPQYLHPGSVRPLLAVAVRPEDFPLPVYAHDRAHVAALSRDDPWGFPWWPTA